MSQTSISLEQPVAQVGMIADTGNHDIHSKVLSAATSIGVLVVRDASDDKVKVPTTAAEVAGANVAGGVLVHNHAVESDPTTLVPTYPIKSVAPVMRKGRVYVKVEEAVTQGNQAYARYATGIADSGLVQKGAFRKSPDGTAQVATLTPTAVNDAKYFANIYDDEGKLLAGGSYQADGSATATEICDGLRASLGTVPGITLSGTATLIITASVAGTAFVVEADGNIAVAATTPNAQSAAKVPGAYYATSASAGGFAMLDLNLGA